MPFTLSVRAGAGRWEASFSEDEAQKKEVLCSNKTLIAQSFSRRK
jgi:hypothetical protein